MKTVKEVYEESLAAINKTSVIVEVASEIKKITEALGKRDIQNWSADQLSRALNKIAVLRINLGIEMANSMAYYDMSYINRKLRYAAEWKPTKSKLNEVLQRATVQDIDSAIMEKLAGDYLEELSKKHLAETLKVIYDATETLITALQSRLGLLKQERFEARNA